VQFKAWWFILQDFVLSLVLNLNLTLPDYMIPDVSEIEL